MKLLLPLLFLSLTCLGQGAEKNQKKGPLAGEKAVYSLRWSFVSVGDVEISIDENSDVGGLWTATLEAKANAFMRTVYDFHTIIRTQFTEGVPRSEGYIRDERGEETVHGTFFDWSTETVRYSKNGDVREVLALQPGTQDPLSVVFAFRSGAVPLRKGTHPVWVSDGKVIDLIEFKVDGPETVRTPAGKFQAFHITADFKGVRAIFARPEGALIEVWISADDRMIPVQLKSKASMGSFRSILEEYSAPEE